MQQQLGMSLLAKRTTRTTHESTHDTLTHPRRPGRALFI
ncbi:uncharacterized protein METZ01_LOCUS254864 [marine metagenome]|uniref:Uncharacterized protein n=1 Tax=marine metagenome TaxID=408172 RepID=A0A382IQQ3_9ZZZZ